MLALSENCLVVLSDVAWKFCFVSKGVLLFFLFVCWMACEFSAESDSGKVSKEDFELLKVLGTGGKRG